MAATIVGKANRLVTNDSDYFKKARKLVEVQTTKEYVNKELACYPAKENEIFPNLRNTLAVAVYRSKTIGAVSMMRD